MRWASKWSTEHGKKRMSNQMFSQMNLAALARLEGRDPKEIAPGRRFRLDR